MSFHSATPDSEGTAALVIRPGRREDLPAELDIVRAAWEATYANIFSSEEIEGLFAGKLQQSASWSSFQAGKFGNLIAELNGIAVGTVWLGLLRNGEGEVVSLYVHPRYQKQGVGRALWDAAVADLRRRYCPGLRVWVVDRASAAGFYRHVGCTVVGQGSLRIGTHLETVTCYGLKWQGGIQWDASQEFMIRDPIG